MCTDAMLLNASDFLSEDDDDAPMDTGKLGVIAVELSYATRRKGKRKPKRARKPRYYNNGAVPRGDLDLLREGNSDIVPRERRSGNEALSHNTPVHERAKKLASHRVLLTGRNDRESVSSLPSSDDI